MPSPQTEINSTLDAPSCPSQNMVGEVQPKALNLRLLLKQTIAYVPGKLIPALEGILFITLMTRLFTAEAFGQFSLVFNTCIFISALFSEWLQQSITRFLAAAGDAGEKARNKKAITLSYMLIVMSLVLLSVTAMAPIRYFGGEWYGFFWPAFFLTLGLSLYSPLAAILQAEMKPNIFSLSQIAQSSLKLVLVLFLVFFIRKHISWAMWGLAASFLMLVPFLWVYNGLPLRDFFKGSEGLWREFPKIKLYLLYGLPMSGWFFSAILLGIGDQFVIQIIRGAQDLGIYSANYKIVQSGIGLLTAPILFAAHPFLIKAYASCDIKQVSQWLNRIIEWFLIIGMAAVGSMSLLSEDIARIFLGPEFRSGHVIMPVVLAGYVFWQIGMYTHKPLEFKKKTHIMLIQCLVAALINVILNIIFIPIYGYVAAAWTTLISFLIYAISTAYYGKDMVKWDIDWLPLSIIALMASLLFILLNLVVHSLRTSGPFNLMIIKVIGCGLITLMVITTHYYWNKIVHKLTYLKRV